MNVKTLSRGLVLRTRCPADFVFSVAGILDGRFAGEAHDIGGQRGYREESNRGSFFSASLLQDAFEML
jgi:hypothetical protein